jgi:hypothetical protein
VFGPTGDALERPVIEAGSTDEMVRLVEAFLGARLPPLDPTVDLVARLVSEAAADSTLTRVHELARRGETTVRRLQRVFAEYVGASPKMGDPPLPHAGGRGPGRRWAGGLGGTGL